MNIKRFLREQWTKIELLLNIQNVRKTREYQEQQFIVLLINPISKSVSSSSPNAGSDILEPAASVLIEIELSFTLHDC